ncbi:MAG: WD40 repeat domain-containing protein [Gemmataceae bacterium]|nr:WD40 repeat domain-containing protein [Gemmataceae bacterium]
MSRRFLCFVLVALAVAPAFAQEIPPRFRKAEGKFLKLQAAYGTPEVTGAAGSIWSADGKTAIVGSSVPGDTPEKPHQTVFVTVDIATGAPVGSEIRPKDTIDSFALSHDGKRALLSVSSGHETGKPKYEMQWWDLQAGKAIKTLEKSERARFVIGLSPDSKVAVLADYEGAGELYDAEAGKTLKKIEGGAMHGPYGPFDAAAFRPSHSQAIVFQQQNGQLIDTKTGAKLAQVPLPNGFRTNFSFSPSGKTAAVLDQAGIVAWNMETKKSTTAKLPPTNGMADLRLIDDKSALLLQFADDQGNGVITPGKIQRIELGSGKATWTAPIDLKPMTGVAIDADGKTAVMGDGLPPFRRINLADGTIVAAWGGHGDAVTCVASAGKQVVSVGSDGLLIRWGQKGSEKILDLGGNGLRCVLPPRGDSPTIVGAGDGKIRLLDAADKVTLLKGHDAAVAALALAPKSDWFVSASADRTLRTWDSAGKPLDTFSGHSDAVNAVVVTLDEKWLISASDDGTVRFWPIVEGKLAPKGKAIVMDEHKRQVTCLALSEDGKKLASGSQDQTVRIWDVRTRVSKEITGHKNWIASVLFVGDRLATASDDLTIRLWDAQGKAVDTVDLTPALDGPRTLAKADDDALLVGTSGWMILRYTLPK